MAVDDGEDALPEGDGPQHLDAQQRMLLYVAALLLGQRAVGGEQARVELELPDVVEQGREVHGAALVGLKAEAPGHHVRQRRHPARVAGIEHVDAVQEVHEHVRGVGEEIDRLLVEHGVADGRRGLPAELHQQVALLGTQRPHGPARHQQGAGHRPMTKGDGDEPGSRRGHLVRARRIARVVRRPRKQHRLALLRHQRGDALARLQPDPAQRIAAIAHAALDHEPAVVRPAQQHDARGLHLAQISGRGHHQVQEPVEVRLLGHGLRHLLQRLQQAVGVLHPRQQLAVLLHELRALDGAAQRALEQPEVQRGLLEEIEDAVVDALDGGVEGALAGQDEDGHVRAGQPDAAGQLQPVHPRQPDVEDGSGEVAFGGEAPQGFRAAAGADGLEAALLQEVADHAEHDGVVVHEQHARRFGCHFYVQEGNGS